MRTKHIRRRAPGKLTADDVRAIRAAAGREVQASLAARYGVSTAMISAIQRRLVWRHI
jgi:hypothetical protein